MSITKWLHVFFLLFLIAPYTSGQDIDGAAPRRDPYVYSANFNPSMLIIVVVLVSAFFFMGFFSIYIRQCSGDRSVSPGTRVSGPSRPGMKGLEQAEIETFPTFFYSAVKELKIGKGTLECAVCLNEFEDDESLRLLPKCDHVFHSECIDAWLARHITCPVCRANLIPEESSSAESSDHHNNNQDNGISEPEGSAESTQFPIPVVEDQTSSFSSTTSMLGKFPRSNTTGHSIVLQPGGENNERFTLRLPEEIRDQIVNGKLKRSSSCVSFPAGSEAEGTSRGKTDRFWRLDSKPNSDGWVFTMAPPFVSRTGSVRAAKMEQGEGSRSLKFVTSVKKKSFKSSIHCLSVKVDGNEQTALGRPPV